MTGTAPATDSPAPTISPCVAYKAPEARPATSETIGMLVTETTSRKTWTASMEMPGDGKSGVGTSNVAGRRSVPCCGGRGGTGRMTGSLSGGRRDRRPTHDERPGGCPREAAPGTATGARSGRMQRRGGRRDRAGHTHDDRPDHGLPTGDSCGRPLSMGSVRGCVALVEVELKPCGSTRLSGRSARSCSGSSPGSGRAVHQRIGRQEAPELRVVDAPVHVHQAGRVELLVAGVAGARDLAHGRESALDGVPAQLGARRAPCASKLSRSTVAPFAPLTTSVEPR